MYLFNAPTKYDSITIVFGKFVNNIFPSKVHLFTFFKIIYSKILLSVVLM